MNVVLRAALLIVVAGLGACGGETTVTTDGPPGTPDAAPGTPDAAATPDVPGTSDAGTVTLDEEFDSPDALSRLTDLYPALHDSLSVAGGRLGMTPVQVAETHWFSDRRGPLLVKSVTGDFVAEIDVAVGRRADMGLAPRGMFNSAGLVVRDPASAIPGAERWIMYNLGFQTIFVGREAKTTRPNAGESLSTLYLTASMGSALTGRLRICRVAGTFYFFHRHPGEGAFVEEAYDPSTIVSGNGAGEPTPGVVVNGVIRFDRPDFPATVQVGMMVGNWASPYEVRGEFDYLRFGPAASLGACTAPLP